LAAECDCPWAEKRKKRRPSYEFKNCLRTVKFECGAGVMIERLWARTHHTLCWCVRGMLVRVWIATGKLCPLGGNSSACGSVSNKSESVQVGAPEPSGPPPRARTTARLTAAAVPSPAPPSRLWPLSVTCRAQCDASARAASITHF